MFLNGSCAGFLLKTGGPAGYGFYSQRYVGDPQQRQSANETIVGNLIGQIERIDDVLRYPADVPETEEEAAEGETRKLRRTP